MAVAAAAQGCQNHSALASSGMWAMWGQETDPQTHSLGRWPHYRCKLGIQHRLGLIAWGPGGGGGPGIVFYLATCTWREISLTAGGGGFGLEFTQMWAARAQASWVERAAFWTHHHPPPPHCLPIGQKPADCEEPLFSSESQRRPSRQSAFFRVASWPRPERVQSLPGQGQSHEEWP